MPALLTPQQQRTLVDRIRSREPSAEEELVRLFSGRVRSLVLARTRDRETARDLTQDVLLAVVLALRDGHLREPERLAAFVCGTARNVVNNYLRTRSRQPREDPLDPGCDPAFIPDQLENTERDALVRQALGTLDSTDRKILSLTLVESLKPGEIALRLGLPSEGVSLAFMRIETADYPTGQLRAVQTHDGSRSTEPPYLSSGHARV